jgi:hypothetical protein
MTSKSDIVERLRAAVKNHRGLPVGYVCQDAADEIERLHTALDQASFASLRIGEGEMSNEIIKKETVERIEAKCAEITAWMTDHAPYVGTEQAHLKPGTRERAYWHYGYLAALQDILYLLGRGRGKK